MHEVADIRFEGINIKTEGIVDVLKKSTTPNTTANKDQMPNKHEDLKSNPQPPS